MFTNAMLTNFLSRFPSQKHSALIKAFLSSLDKHTNNCIDAVKNENITVLQDTVHDVKSLGYTIGNNTLGDLAKEVEDCITATEDKQAFEKAAQLIPMMTEMTSILNSRNA